MKVVFLVKESGSDELQEQVFDRLPILIGRSKICDLSINDPIASRQHCVLELDSEKRLRLVDLDSANGTLVRGEKVQKYGIQVGEKFQVGETEIELEKWQRGREETTVHDLTPIQDLEPLEEEKTGTIKVQAEVPSQPLESDQELGAATSKESAEEQLPPQAQKQDSKKESLTSEVQDETVESASQASEGDDDEVSLKTPTVLRAKTQKPTYYQTKDWVQVSLFWKNDLIDVQCFDQGHTVRVGSDSGNDFVLDFPLLPKEFPLLKIAKQGVELAFHNSMKGLVETRGKAQDLDELRKYAQPSSLGFSTFIPFEDRCLVEIGPFSFFIQSVKLRIAKPLEALLVKEPLFSGIVSSLSVAMLVFLVVLGQLSDLRSEEEDEEEIPVVRLEAPEDDPPAQQVTRTPPPQPPQPESAPSREQDLQAEEGEGARAQGAEGSRGREEGISESEGRDVGVSSSEQEEEVSDPQGAMGEEEDRAQAERGRRPEEGSATGSPQEESPQRQAPSPEPEPEVRVEDEGLLGVFSGRGGGGEAAEGGELEDTGLGGRLEGVSEGLERGERADARGAGGRGERGRDFGGGGDAVDIGGLGTRGRGGGDEGFGIGTSGEIGEAEVSYQSENVVVRDGLTREEIREVVLANQREIQACYEEALISAGGDVAGRARVEWFVNSRGRVENIKLVSRFGREAGLYDCMRRRISEWQFPRPRGGAGAGVLWPFVFQRGG